MCFGLVPQIIFYDISDQQILNTISVLHRLLEDKVKDGNINNNHVQSELRRLQSRLSQDVQPRATPGIISGKIIFDFKCILF